MKASLADPSGFGFWGKLLAICVLVALNSIVTTAAFHVLETSGVRWLSEPRLGQPILFMMPLLLLSLELWLGSMMTGAGRR